MATLQAASRSTSKGFAAGGAARFERISELPVSRWLDSLLEAIDESQDIDL